MTNKEIKFELGKIALSKCNFMSSEDLSSSLKNVFEWIIEEPTEEVIPEKPVNDYEQKPIREVYNEMQCIEEAEKAEKMTGNNWQKHGHARRFLNVANYYNIETVGQLLEIGKADFMRLKNMGRKCADYVSMALKNLYGIEKW